MIPFFPSAARLRGIALVATAAWLPGAHATYFLQSSSSSLDDSGLERSVTATTAAGSTTATASRGFALPAFDSSRGVLVGAQVSYASRIDTQLTGSATRRTGLVGVLEHGGSFQGTVGTTLSMPGATVSGTQSQTSGCSVLVGRHCSTGTLNKTQDVQLSASVTDTAALDAYVDRAASARLDRVASASATPGSSRYTASATFAVDDGAGQASVDVRYAYLQHAVPSFSQAVAQDTLLLDFGTLAAGGDATLSFGLFNLTGKYRTGLQFLGADGGAAGFTLGTRSFSNLAAGAGSLDWSVIFDPQASGAYSGRYTLYFGDTDAIGAAASRGTNYQLVLDVRGAALAPAVTAPVPEPAEWATMAAGLAVVGVAARRRRSARRA